MLLSTRLRRILFTTTILAVMPAALAQDVTSPLTSEAINGAVLANLLLPAAAAEPAETTVAASDAADVDGEAIERPDPAIVKLQVLLDRAGASPGVIDGYDGENVAKAVLAYELMNGLPADGVLDDEMLLRLDRGENVAGTYTISEGDVADVTGPTPTDYAEMAQLDFLGWQSAAEALAERFHMDIDLLAALNPDAGYAAGETIVVVDPGSARTGTVTRIEADKELRQLRAYDVAGLIVAAYPATIGSEDNPSPSGTHEVVVAAPMPNYTYNPEINFQQGDNTGVLTIPPGPNGPVGSMWIDLSEPTYGIHGTPEPSLIDKTGSHGCVRLTNWDAEELAAMVSEGVPVEFIGG